MFHFGFMHFLLRGSQSNIGFTNEKMFRARGTVTVITSVNWISSKIQDEGVTRVRVGAMITSAAYSRGEVGDISAIMGLGPDSSPINIIAISPVPSLGVWVSSLTPCLMRQLYSSKPLICTNQPPISSHSPLASSQLSFTSEKRN